MEGDEQGPAGLAQSLFWRIARWVVEVDAKENLTSLARHVVTDLHSCLIRCSHPRAGGERLYYATGSF